jgi:hypothetical protein
VDIAQWARERLVVDPMARTSAHSMYEDYVAWVRSRPAVLGDVAMTHVQFGRAAVTYGLRRTRDKHGRVYLGVALR